MLKRKPKTNFRDVCKYFVETSSQDGDEANGGSEPNHKEVALLVRLHLCEVSCACKSFGPNPASSPLETLKTLKGALCPKP
jgi:hypothetical protein